MKVLLFAVFILSAGIVFSQPRSKTTGLFDSLSKIELTDNLYKQIGSLKTDIENVKDEARGQLANYSDLEEFCVRQNVYRTFFDNLESGGKPGADLLSSYYNTMNNALFKIPASTDSFPIKIYYQRTDTAKTPAGKQRFGKFPLYDFAREFLSNDTLLTKRYPKAYSMLKNGKLVFESADLRALPVETLQVPEFVFPTFYLKNNTLDSKKALANDLLVYILEQGSTLISYLQSKGYDVDGDLIEEYQKLEREKYTKATLDDKIRIRRKFIEYLKTLYSKYE